MSRINTYEELAGEPERCKTHDKPQPCSVCNTKWKQKSAPNIEFTIFIAGDMGAIKGACRKHCEMGFCVSIKPAEYVYKFGAESGAEITLINYPRFPSDAEALWHHANTLARMIAEEANQGSYTIVGPLGTEFFSRRDFD